MSKEAMKQSRGTPAKLFLMLLLLLLSGCAASGKNEASSKPRITVHDILLPQASGKQLFENDHKTVSVDASDVANGYVMIRYTGSSEKIQIQIKNPDQTVNPYPLMVGEYEAFPFTKGSGDYQINVLEQIHDDQYAVAFSNKITVELSDEFRPFLYPNQYVRYTADSLCVETAEKLSEEAPDDLHFVQNVYHYIIDNIVYDQDLAANAPTNYIPEPDRTLTTGKGICFDYAALTCAMLRSQNIPTKLVVGYSGDIYHAWISVYLTSTGWLDNVIEFSGDSWSLIDPTLGANNSADSVREYVGDGGHYTVKYYY